MKTFQRFLIFAVLSLSTAACNSSKQDDPQPVVAPKPSYKMGSYVFYPEHNFGGGTSYSPLRLQGHAQWHHGQLKLVFKSDLIPDDVVEFMMPASFSPSKLGTFTCQSAPNPLADAVQVTHTLTYQLDPTTKLSKLFRGREHTTEGKVIITAYDERTRVISGTYEVEFKNVPDPHAELTPNRPIKKSEVSVFGEFNNVPIQY